MPIQKGSYPQMLCQTEKPCGRLASFMNLRVLNRCIFSLCFVSGICFVSTVNDLAVQGIALNKLKAEIKEVRETNDRLEALAMDRSSLDSVSLKAEEMGLKPVGQIAYIPADSSVAMR